MVYKENVAGKNVTVIGTGKSGKASAILASALGARVFVSDIKNEIPAETAEAFREHGVSFETGGHSEAVWDSDLLILSSGVSPDSLSVRGARERNIPLMGELDLVYPFLRGKIIGVTGSNGKTTTTSLIGHMLSSGGYRTAVAGNIGNPASLYANEDLDFVVLELSSFQLYWSELLRVDMAIVTNLAPDHIDWHGSYENYIRSKMKLLGLRRDNAPAILQQRDMDKVEARYMDSLIVPFSWGGRRAIAGNSLRIEGDSILLNYHGSITRLADLKDIPLIGDHNTENMSMALAGLSLLSIPCTDLPSLLKGFVTPPHRCEFVARINGVTFIDDSKGTNVAATVTALTSIRGPKIIILGGQGKGEDYSPLFEAVGQHATEAIAIGQEKETLVSGLYEYGYSRVHGVGSMEEAVTLAYDLAGKECTVLLSPACTSWDMYESYKKRGEHFKSLVRRLEKHYQDRERK